MDYSMSWLFRKSSRQSDNIQPRDVQCDVIYKQHALIDSL